MELKINRYNFNVTNKDWILDNGVCYQCVTLLHTETSGSPYYIPHDYWTVISKKQFKELFKKGKIVRYTELENTEKFHNRYGRFGMKAYRFNFEE